MRDKIKVFIATTEGPAEVERLTEEDPSVQSAICLQGKAVALPVSPDYDTFVRQPTGVIERAFGHRVYRMDVSRAVTSGVSWQLGALLAHGLHHAGRLAKPHEDAALLVWTTGEVDRDLRVLPIEHLEAKLRASAEFLRQAERDDAKVLVCLPEGNRQEFLELCQDGFGDLQHPPEVLLLESSAELFTRLGLAVPENRANAAMRTPPSSPLRKALWLAVLAVAGTAALAYGLGGMTRQAVPLVGAPEVTADARGHIGLIAVETRAPPDGSCAAVALGAVSGSRTEVTLPTAARRSSSELETLCNLHYLVRNAGQARDLWVVGTRGGTESDRRHSKVLISDLHLGSGDSQSFDVVLPRRFRTALYQDFAIISKDADQNNVGSFAAHALRLPQHVTAEAWQDWLKALRADGFAVQVASHALIP